MAEIVQYSEEQFICVYETVRNLDLLSSDELDQFIKKCDRYEYRIQKSVSVSC